MEYVTSHWLVSCLIAVVLMALLWTPLFFFDFRAEKKRRGWPAGSGEDRPTPPLDKVHLN
jgi:hypothetical protein